LERLPLVLDRALREIDARVARERAEHRLRDADTRYGRVESRRLALVELGDRIRDLDDPGDLAYAAAEILGRELNIDRAGYGMVDKVAETITIERDWTAPGVASLAGLLHFRDYGSYIEQLQHGITVSFADARTDPRTRDNAEALIAITARAVVNMPLAEKGGLVGLLYLNHGSVREWSADELAFVRDVAERIRAAIARREAQIELQALATSLERQVEERTYERDRTWTLSQDLLGVANDRGFFESLNPAWEHVLGWSREEIRATPFRNLVHPADLETTNAELERLMRGERTNGFENRYRTKSGVYRWLSWTAVPDRGLLYSAARDITEQKEHAAELEAAREQLRQSQKLEAVGQLTGGVAHDFNNLLQVISGNLHLMARTCGDDPRQQKRVAAALAAVQKGAQLSSQLLAFSRRQALAPKPIDVGELCHGMEDLLRRTIGEQIDVRITRPEDLWTAYVDPAQFENAVLNLAINSRDAMKGGGRLMIDVENRTLDRADAVRGRGKADSQYVMIAVSDTGSGIPPEVLKQVFEPFFTTKPVGSGTGLGLSMVYGFVKQSGGHIDIDSEVDLGTTVKIFLPRSSREAEPVVEAVPEVVQGGSETVLVVEDNADVRTTVVELLSELGYRTLEAEDAAAALAVLQRGAPVDLLFTDVVMPGKLKSIDLAELARHTHPNIGILFTSGYTRDLVVQGALLEARAELLTKPYARDTLARKIRAALDRTARR
ncbi:MAG: ATP-binding protein, partial [Pseudomonadota bacterium]